MHVLTLLQGAQPRRLVLRRFVREDWLAREPDLARHEAAALRLLEGSQLPVPRLIAVDEDGSSAGAPSVLMTWLPGRVQLQLRDLDSWLAQMAALLPQLHALQPATAQFPWVYAPYTQPRDIRVPEWAARSQAWAAIIELARGPRPRAPESLIHRDYHPANLLWFRGRITGIVDWVNACRGPTGVDIGHCRRNLAIIHGVAVADRFLEHCLDWADYNPYWDILSLLDAELDTPVYSGWLALGAGLTRATAHTRLDEYAASLEARL